MCSLSTNDPTTSEMEALIILFMCLSAWASVSSGLSRCRTAVTRLLLIPAPAAASEHVDDECCLGPSRSDVGDDEPEEEPDEPAECVGDDGIREVTDDWERVRLRLHGRPDSDMSDSRLRIRPEFLRGRTAIKLIAGVSYSSRLVLLVHPSPSLPFK